MVIENSKSLEAILYGTDIYAQLPHQGFQMAYITSHNLHPTDVEKVSWLLTMGVPDAWVQQVPQAHPIVRGPVHELPQGRRRYHPVEPMYPKFNCEGPAITFIRLGAALRVFDENHLCTQAIKFLIAVDSKYNSSWAKLMICYTRQAALTTIVHEILCDNSISFVGAVLSNAPIPACITGGAPKMRFEWAAEFDEMDVISHDIIRVLC